MKTLIGRVLSIVFIELGHLDPVIPPLTFEKRIPGLGDRYKYKGLVNMIGSLEGRRVQVNEHPDVFEANPTF